MAVATRARASTSRRGVARSRTSGIATSEPTVPDAIGAVARAAARSREHDDERTHDRVGYHDPMVYETRMAAFRTSLW